MTSPLVRTIEATAHGRFLLALPARPGPSPLLAGFHGYGENAERHLEQLQQIPGTGAWLIASIQGLHRFHNKNDEVVASWMTRQDRELAIADNLAYVNGVVSSIRREFETRVTVFAGFSQGVAMAYRAAAIVDARVDGVVALGGNLPPEIDRNPAVRLPPVLIGRGTRDPWYTAEKLEDDVSRLQGLGADVRTLIYDGGHEWTEMFRAAAGAFLAELKEEGRSKKEKGLDAEGRM